MYKNITYIFIRIYNHVYNNYDLDLLVFTNITQKRLIYEKYILFFVYGYVSRFILEKQFYTLYICK